jgi:TolB-like protein
MSHESQILRDLIAVLWFDNVAHKKHQKRANDGVSQGIQDLHSVRVCVRRREREREWGREGR